MGESLKYIEEDRNCDICGSDNYKHIRTTPDMTETRVIREGEKRFHTTDVMCMNCGLIYKKPCMTRESIVEFYKDEYIKLFSPRLNMGIPKTEILSMVTDTILFMEWINKNNIPIEGKRILNVGAGVGVLSYFLRNYGANIYSIEPGPRSREVGEKLFCLKYIDSYFENYSPSEKYDIIIFQNSLEHFYSGKECMNHAREMINDDGIVIIEVPDVYMPYPNISIDGWLSSAHVFHYSKDSIINLCNISGFTAKTISYDGDKSKMLILAEKCPVINNIASDNNIDESYAKLMEIFKELEMTNIMAEKWNKELLKQQDVKGYIVANIGNLKYNSNRILLRICEGLISHGMNNDVLYILENIKWNDSQPDDIGTNKGVFYYLLSMIARNMGDMIKMRKMLDLSISHYPPFYKYNLFRDMNMNGILSQGVMQNLHYYQSIKMKELYN